MNDPNHSAPTTIRTKILAALYAYGDLTWKNMLTLNFSLRNDWSSALTYADGHWRLFLSISKCWISMVIY